MALITIDGIEKEIADNTTILEAAKSLGIYIPTLCYHEALTPYGGCRLCLVQIYSGDTEQVVPACTYKAFGGLTVKTATDKVLALRKFMVELLLAEAPQAPVLQQLAVELGVREPVRFQPRNELCIACGLCIRACREIVSVSAIDFAKRGYEKIAASPFFERSDDCIGCGTCVAICPTGAITMEDIAEGEKATLPDGQEIKGPARIIDNWKVGHAMKICKQCGEPFAPQFQLEYIAKKVSLAEDYYDVCVECRS